jgi:hypothetical protein
VSAGGDRLEVGCGRMVCDLERWHYDVFKARPRRRFEMDERRSFGTFDVDAGGRASGLRFSTGSVSRRLPERASTITP